MLLVAGLAASPTSGQQTPDQLNTDDLFELGDGSDPVVPGAADVLGASEQGGPDWGDLFDAQRGMRDVYDEFGALNSNGVPDFLDTFGSLRLRRDAAFLVDEISAGTGVDDSILVGPGALGSGTVAPAYDLGNAYAYSAFNGSGDLILYTGIERLTPGAGMIEVEFNQALFSISTEGAIQGDRTVGDLRLQAHFSTVLLSSVEVSKWQMTDPESETYGWVPVETLPIIPEETAEQCNASSTLCALCNGASVESGDWPSYDAEGNVAQELGPDSFIEIGVNVSALLGTHTYANYYETRYVSMQLSTYDDGETAAGQDYILGGFVRASRLVRR